MADIKELPEKIENEKNEECLLKDSKLLGINYYVNCAMIIQKQEKTGLTFMKMFLSF